jgi:small GTP-binding protein
MIGDNLDKLLKNLIASVENIELVSIIDKQGLPVASSTKSDEDYVIAAVTSHLETFINRMRKEFSNDTENIVSNFTFIENHKFFFTNAGEDAILTIVGNEDASENELKVFGEFVAKKIKRILQSEENVSISIPRIIKAYSKFKDGKIPKGKFIKKIVICGDNKVGKTSMIRRFIDNSFEVSYKPTLGIDILEKDIEINDETFVHFLIWDIDGQIQNMTPYRKKFYKGAEGVFLIFDMTSKQTFLNIKKWLKDLSELEGKDFPIILIGNKIDLNEKIAVSEEEIKSLSEELGLEIIEASAKTSENVEEIFKYMSTLVIS